MQSSREDAMSHLTIRTLPDEKAKGLARRLKQLAPDLEFRVCGNRDFGLIEDPEHNVRTLLERRPISDDLLSSHRRGGSN
jgi:hypothetical protein